MSPKRYVFWAARTAALVAPGVILNKDGSFQRTARFRGPDLESATEAELIGAELQLLGQDQTFASVLRMAGALLGGE